MSFSHTSRSFVTISRVDAQSRVIQNQDGAYSTDVTLVALPNCSRRTQALKNCLGPQHTRRQGLTRRFEIQHVPDTARHLPILQQTSLYLPHNRRQEKIFCRQFFFRQFFLQNVFIIFICHFTVFWFTAVFSLKNYLLVLS